MMPGTGGLVAAVQVASGVQPVRLDGNGGFGWQGGCDKDPRVWQFFLTCTTVRAQFQAYAMSTGRFPNPASVCHTVCMGAMLSGCVTSGRP